MTLGVFGSWTDSGMMTFAVRVVSGISVVWLLAWMCALALRRSSAALRHRIWTLSVAIALVLPMAATLLPECRIGAIPLPAIPAPAVDHPAQPPHAQASPLVPRQPESVQRGISSSKPGESLAVSTGTASRPPANVTRQASTNSRQTGRSAAWVLAAWLAPALWLMLRHALALLAARNLRRRAMPIEDPGTLSRLAARLGLTATPCLLESPATGSPICIGWLRPSIALPKGWRRWPAGQLEAVLTHELAHVARRDVLWQMLARLSCAVYWFHPLAWAAAWQIRVERELACDDWVLRGGESSTRYARWLLDVAAMLSGKACAEGAGVAMASGTNFQHRIAAILDTRRRRLPLSRPMAAMLTVTAAILLGMVGMVSPLAPQKAAGQATKNRPQTNANSRPATQPAASARKTVPLSGTVVDEQDHPVGDVLVEADIGSRRQSARTALDGRFVLQISENAGTSLRAATRDGLKQAFVLRERPIAGPQEIRVALKPAREFSITVRDDKDQPVGAAWVACTGTSMMKVGEAKTDAAGKAQLHIPADAFPEYILARKDGLGLDYVAFWRKDELRTDPYRLAPDHSGPVNLVLNGAKSVKIRVVDEQDKPLPDVMIYPWLYEKPRKGTLLNLSGLAEVYKTTDAQGAAAFEVPADNTKAINFWPRREGYCAPKRCMWDPTSGAAEVQTTMLRMLTVRGRVVNAAGQAIAGALVRCGGQNYEINRFGGQTTTSDDGSYQFEVNPEMYYIFVAGKERMVSKAHAEMIHKQAPAAPIQLTLSPAIRLGIPVTGGPGNAPIPKASVSLSQQDERYYGLPKEEQFPGGTVGRPYLAPSVTQHAEADEKGVVEFWIGPGDFSIHGYAGGSNQGQSFKLSDTGECVVRHYEDRRIREETLKVTEQVVEIPLNFPDAKPQMRFLKGRVILKDQPDAGVAEAALSGVPVDRPSPVRIEGASDRDGNFTVRRGKSELYLSAVTADGKLRGIVKVAAGEESATVPVGPTASARGRLVDEAGNALAGRQIEYGVRIGSSSGTFSWHFGGSVKTGDGGEFVVEGLVPGHVYDLNVATEFGDEGRPRSWQTAGKAKADRVERVDLGDVRLKETPRPNRRLEP